MINWNEKREAKKLYESMNFDYIVDNLQLIAKYIRDEEFPEVKADALREKLLDRMDDYLAECRHKGILQYDPFYMEWAQPLRDAVEIAVNERIQDQFPVGITAGEWQKIKKIGNEEIERLLFVMLVAAKYSEIVKDRKDKEDKSHPYRIELEDPKIRKLAKVKVHRGNVESKNCYREYLKENGYIDLSGRNQIYILFAEEGKPVETVTDYDDLDLHYSRLNGENIGICKKCGKLFKQNKQNNLQLCKECRTYQPKESIECKCVDCGITYFKKPTEKRKCRCAKCQEKHEKVLKKARNQRYYVNKK